MKEPLMWLQDWAPRMVGCTVCDWTHAMEKVTPKTTQEAATAFRIHAKEAHGVTQRHYNNLANK
jgi:hypothetical protein